MWSIGKWYLIAFLLMFLLRLFYGYYNPNNNGQTETVFDDFFSSVENLHRNYASEKKSFKDGAFSQPQNPSPTFSTDQKYEKTASLKAKSSEFETDNANVRNLVKSSGAIIQYEQMQGLEGSQELHLMIGVDPAKFDSFFVAIQRIGRNIGSNVTKVDKTNDYLQLNAQRISLEKNLASLAELKKQGGPIADLITLNERILEVERQLQELGVQLGNFDSLNEFCTVRFSLYEGQPRKGISTAQRIKVALEWTIEYYSILVFTSGALIFSIYIVLLLADKLKLIQAIFNKLNKPENPS